MNKPKFIRKTEDDVVEQLLRIILTYTQWSADKNQRLADCADCVVFTGRNNWAEFRMGINVFFIKNRKINWFMNLRNVIEQFLFLNVNPPMVLCSLLKLFSIYLPIPLMVKSPCLSIYPKRVVMAYVKEGDSNWSFMNFILIGTASLFPKIIVQIYRIYLPVKLLRYLSWYLWQNT